MATTSIDRCSDRRRTSSSIAGAIEDVAGRGLRAAGVARAPGRRRLRGDRWKVFKGQNDSWLEEYRLYHRDVDGRVVKGNDDAISASRYAMMMRRHGRSGGWDFFKPIAYPQIGLV